MIIDQLTEDMKTALKAGDKTKLGTVRMLLSELKNAKIAKGEGLTDAESQRVLTSYAKKRKEAMEQANEIGREDLVTKEQEEYDVTMSYLPEQMGEDELRAIVQKHVDASGGGKQAFGLVMKAVLTEVGGQAEGKVVSGMVKELLQ